VQPRGDEDPFNTAIGNTADLPIQVVFGMNQQETAELLVNLKDQEVEWKVGEILWGEKKSTQTFIKGAFDSMEGDIIKLKTFSNMYKFSKENIYKTKGIKGPKELKGSTVYDKSNMKEIKIIGYCPSTDKFLVKLYNTGKVVRQLKVSCRN
jgi:ERCC4-type nuclease